MRHNRFLWFLLVLLFIPAVSRAQAWSGIIAPSRAIDWSTAGVPGGIPNRSAICATLSPGATTAQINSALSSCAANGVVFLNAGVYNLSSGITFGSKNNVTLRGAGANATFLIFSSSSGCNGLSSSICIPGTNQYAGGPNNVANWTAGYSKGTTQITLSSTTNLVAGSSIIELDQLDDTNTDTGSIWVCQSTSCSTEGPSGGGRSGRVQGHMARVTAINGNVVTIDPPLYMPNWRADRSPGAWWANSIRTGDGIENLSITNAIGGTSAIVIMNAKDSWVQGVRSINANRNHVFLYLSSHVTVRDSYFYETQNHASVSYGIEVFQGGDYLIENNIFERVTAPMNMNGSGSGTVFGYNFNRDDTYTNASWMQAGMWLHSGGVDNILFEGNNSVGFTSDAIHGTHHFITLFRNQLYGWETGKTAQTTAANIYSYSRYFNVIGNVLGKSGYHTLYEDSPTNNVDGNKSAYTIGFLGNGGTGSTDSLTYNSMFRWGNFDTVTNTAKFQSSEVPNGLSLYGNPVPASQNLPASFYLNGRPAWWGTMPFPATGPDVSGGTEYSGKHYANPAQRCYNTTPKDSSGTLSFNADACYEILSTAPAPPTNIRAVVQ